MEDGARHKLLRNVVLPMFTSGALRLIDPKGNVIEDGMLILTMTGTDETTGQDVTARTVYPAKSLHWNHAFRDILSTDEDGVDLVDYSQFDQVVPLPPAE